MCQGGGPGVSRIIIWECWRLTEAIGNKHNATMKTGLKPTRRPWLSIPENPAVYGARGELHSALGILEMVRNNIKQAEFYYESALRGS